MLVVIVLFLIEVCWVWLLCVDCGVYWLLRVVCVLVLLVVCWIMIVVCCLLLLLYCVVVLGVICFCIFV